jgi:iron complex outermembrane receptor protein
MNSIKFWVSCVLLFTSISVISQTTLKGRVLDASSGEPMYGVVIGEKGTGNGTISNFDGDFSLKVDKLPTVLVVNLVGYVAQELNVASSNKLIEVKLAADNTVTGTVEVVEDRILEKQKRNPLTVENMDAIAIKEVPTGNFYEGLAALKGVDMASASLAFRVINTRGFNSTSPVRVLQLIDGVDNQSPGLNFSLGNFLGAPDLDVKSVDIIQGASSAFFGPGAFNGVINMETKDPFFTPGLSASIKVAERNLVNPSVRWADYFKNKEGKPFFAYKLNLYYLQAYDWEADNYDPIYGSKDGSSNPGRYDAVNIYGDEFYAGNDFSTNAPWNSRALTTFYRPGYKEIDLVDYNTRNFKTNAALHWRLKPDLEYDSPELILQGNYGNGTTVYQGDNRFSLRGIQFMQGKVELKKKDKYFIRVYGTTEDAGRSYDPYFTALRLRDATASQDKWSDTYVKYWNQTVTNAKLQGLGYPQLQLNPNPVNFPYDLYLPYDYNAYDQWMNLFSDSLLTWHNAALNHTSNILGTLEPGTERFNDEFDRITSSKNNQEEQGTRFYDKSALYHIQGEYRWNFMKLDELRVGGNGRMYRPNSDGTIFVDTSGHKLTNWEVGAYVGLEKKILEDQLTINATVRFDKNVNFDGLVSPALTFVYTPVKNHYFRASLTSALRNPTLTDQYLNLNVGPAILRGNLDGVTNLITVESFNKFRSTQKKTDLEYFDLDPIRPEQARTIELGYRGTIKEKVFVDASVYNTWYDHFIGYRLGLDVPFDSDGNAWISKIQPYRYSANSQNQVVTRGANLGVSYYFYKSHVFTANYSYNKLAVTDEEDPIIPAFNTPLHKFNVGFNARELFKSESGNSWGYAINYKWVDNYFWEGSPQFTGPVDKYDLVDAQINYTLQKHHLNFKVGCSNLFNNVHIEAYGGPYIGRMAYVTILYDWQKK